MIKKKGLLLTLCLSLSVVLNVVLFSNTYADVDTATIIKKWTVAQYLNCADNGALQEIRRQAHGNIEQVKNFVMNDGGSDKALPSFNFGGIGTGLRKETNSSVVSCKELFLGISGFNGALSYTDQYVANTTFDNTVEVEKLLVTDLGYTVSGNSNEVEISAKSLTGLVNVNSSVRLGTLKNNGGYFDTPIFKDAENYAKFEIKKSGDNYDLVITPKSLDPCYSDSANAQKAQTITLKKGDNANTVAQKINEKIKGGLTWSWTCNTGVVGYDGVYSRGKQYKLTLDNVTASASADNAVYRYYANGGMSKERGYKKGDKVVKNLFGESTGAKGQVFSNPEKATIFQYYVKMAVAQTSGKVDCESESNPDTSAYVETHLVSGEMKTCYVSFGGIDAGEIKVVIPKNKNVNGKTELKYPAIAKSDMGEVLNILKGFNAEDFDGVGDWDAIPGSSSVDGEVEPTCANSGAAESLGWIVCPILEWMSNAAEDVYNSVVEPSLEVQASMFAANGGGSNVQAAWDVFRNIANGLFIVFLLVVIFSQLTGVGIDNYGIKKILPKLILSALLINISYLICLLCVDLSNIVGNGIQGIFNGISFGSDSGSMSLSLPRTDGGNESVGIDTGVAITAVTILAGVFAVIGVIANPAILLTLLVSALGVLISILFLFVLLAGRQAVVVVLTVISPLAFIMLMLPNMKTYFDRWLKLWGAMLLLYPICGLLVSGGNFVSKLMLSIGGGAGVFQAFTAMIVGVIPIFFIPTVLKTSFSALGSIGSKIAGVGDTLSGKTTKKARESEGYRAAQQRGYARKTRIKAGYNKDYQPTAIGNIKSKFANTGFGRAIGYGSLQRARVAAAVKNRDTDIEADTALRNVQLEYNNLEHPNESTEAYLTNQLREAAASNDENAIFAVIDQMRGSNMQASHIAQATRNILGSQVMNKNFLERFAKRYSGDFLRKDYEQADWARKGGIDANGVRSALGTAGADGTVGGGQWAAGNMSLDDMKDEDVASLSSDRLHDLIQAGKVTQSQAQRVWASNSNMDDTNRLILGAYGNDGTQLSKQDAQFELDRNAVGPHRLSQEQVEAFTRRAAEAVVVEDVDIRNRHDGTNEQSDVLYVHDSGPGNNPAPKPRSTPPTPPTPPGTSSSTGNPIGFS